MKNILIVKTSSLGDIIHVYPALNYLKERFPEAEIDWVVESECLDLVQTHPSVTKAIKVCTKMWRKHPFRLKTHQEIRLFRQEIKAKSYDVVFDFQGNIKSGLILSQVKSKHKVGFAFKSVPEWPNLLFTHHRFNPLPHKNIRYDYLSLVSSFFQEERLHEEHREQKTSVELKISEVDREVIKTLIESHQEMKVLVCPGSAWANKQLNEDTLRSFLDHVQFYLNCTFFLIWGSKEEYEIANRLQKDFPRCSKIVDKMSLPNLQNLMSRSNLVIAMDSLPLHLAGTTKTPTYSVFGASSAKKYKPIGDHHHAYQGKCPYKKTFVKRCTILRTCPTGACIHDLKTKDLFLHFKMWWQNLHSTCSSKSPVNTAELGKYFDHTF